MAASRTRIPHNHGADQDLRDQEVRRAKKELDGYFKGMRTEREARAALKIIKAFVRDRERMDPAKRRPLSVAPPARTAAKKRARVKAGAVRTIRHRQSDQKRRGETGTKSDAAGTETDSNPTVSTTYVKD